MGRKLLFILLFVVSVFATGCKDETQPAQSEDLVANEEENDIEKEEAAKYICNLTNLRIEEESETKLRPIAVMIDNEYNARPQSGLYSAEIVFEIPVEGNITRYMGIYHHMPSEKIGPVRSARPYFIDKALEFGAIYVHCGGSPQALKDLEDLKVNAFNDLKGTPVFWRAKDRKAPHNLYTSTKYLREISESKKLENNKEIKYFQFNDEFMAPEGAYIKKVTINYTRNYIVSYIYDEEERIYKRFINDVLMMDSELQKEAKASNIIIERVGMKVIDSVGRLELSNLGKNRGYFLTGGKLIEIQWEKSSRSSRTIYRDLQGREIKLNPGVTWVQVVSGGTNVEFEEDQGGQGVVVKES